MNMDEVVAMIQSRRPDGLSSFGEFAQPQQNTLYLVIENKACDQKGKDDEGNVLRAAKW